MKAAAVLAVAAVALAACGAVAPGGAAGVSPAPSASASAPVSASAPPARPPAASPPAAPAFTLSDADDGRVVSVRPGRLIEVALHQQQGFTTWSGLASSDPAVLRAVADPGATAVRGVTLGRFLALAGGSAQLHAGATVMCSTGAMCPALARAWTATVRVG